MYEEIIIPKELKDASIISRFMMYEFCILEDMEKKNYILFDIKKDWRYMVIPFGEMFSIVINSFIDSDDSSVHHNDLFEFIPKDNVDNMIKCKPMVDVLLQVISNMDLNKNYPDKEALKCAYIREWKKFRYINCDSIYSQYADYFLPGTYYEKYKDLYETPEQAEYYNDLDLNELSSDLHNVVSEFHFKPYDVVFAKHKDGYVHGVAWFASNVDYIFSRDLYHLFVDNMIESPHVCPRCGHLYYSSNNKSKYCNECKEKYNEIRKEYRQKNSARYIHKRINDKLHSKRFSKSDLNRFMIESNYYWDILNEREPQTTAENWYIDIKTEDQYKSWLEEKLKEYSVRKQ